MDFYNTLQELCAISAVAGFESQIEQYIIDFSRKHDLPVHHVPGYGVVVGNEKASHYVIAHTDEVGGKVTHVAPAFKFDGIGRVNPSLFVGREIEIKTSEGVVYGLVVGNDALSVQSEYADLNIVLDEHDKKKVFVGDSLRYKFAWNDYQDTLCATSLDNRFGCAQLLFYILHNKNSKTLFEKVAFCFCGDEEVRNKGAIYFVKNYMPQHIAVIDMIPHHFCDRHMMDKVIIQKKTSDFSLSDSLLSIVSEYDVHYLESNDPHLVDSEAKKYKDITGGDAINIYTPMYNYHHGSYMVSKSLVESSNELIIDFLNKFITI